jgi:hypothetical protein
MLKNIQTKEKFESYAISEKYRYDITKGHMTLLDSTSLTGLESIIINGTLIAKNDGFDYFKTFYDNINNISSINLKLPNNLTYNIKLHDEIFMINPNDNNKGLIMDNSGNIILNQNLTVNGNIILGNWLLKIDQSGNLVTKKIASI